MSECQLGSFGQCCCKCIHRLIDYHHPCTTGKTMLEPRGYICNAPFDEEKQHYFSGWMEHAAGCEMYDDKERKTKTIFTCDRCAHDTDVLYSAFDSVGNIICVCEKCIKKYIGPTPRTFKQILNEFMEGMKR